LIEQVTYTIMAPINNDLHAFLCRIASLRGRYPTEWIHGWWNADEQLILPVSVVLPSPLRFLLLCSSLRQKLNFLLGQLSR